jgi:HEAT repeat protein
MGLALLDDRASLGALRKDFAGAHDVELRSWLAEGLGALGSREEIPELLDLAVSDGSDVVRYRAALGLGYAADPQAVPQLVEALGSSSSHPARTALARVLGEIGDRRALPALMAIAGDEKADDWTRRRALGALAMIGQPGDRAWVRTFQRSVDYTRATSTIGTLLSLF